MNPKLLLIVLPLLLLTSSCEEKTAQEVNIYIRNRTTSNVEVELLPASAYSGPAGMLSMYRFSSGGNGYRSCNFAIDTGASVNIFTNGGFSESAAAVARKAFDGIQLTLKNDRNTRIRFYHDSVTNYKTNIFSDDAAWVYTGYMTNYPTQFKSHPTECHDYYFVIDDENIIGK